VDYVLQPYLDAELDGLHQLLPKLTQAVERMVRGDVLGAMTEFNQLK
jgi:hypothetical protein